MEADVRVHPLVRLVVIVPLVNTVRKMEAAVAFALVGTVVPIIVRDIMGREMLERDQISVLAILQFLMLLVTQIQEAQCIMMLY